MELNEICGMENSGLTEMMVHEMSGADLGGAKGASAPPSKIFCSNVNCTCNSMKTLPK